MPTIILHLGWCESDFHPISPYPISHGVLSLSSDNNNGYEGQGTHVFWVLQTRSNLSVERVIYLHWLVNIMVTSLKRFTYMYAVVFFTGLAQYGHSSHFHWTAENMYWSSVQGQKREIALRREIWPTFLIWIQMSPLLSNENLRLANENYM